MGFAPGTSFSAGFTTRRAISAAAFDYTTATSALLFRNGVASSLVTVTVAHAQNLTPANITGAYVVSGTIPASFDPGDICTIHLLVTVDGVTDGEFVTSFVVGLPDAVRSNTAQAGAAGTITLDAGASALDNFYQWSEIRIIAGTGIGQTRVISSYVGSTKVATLNRNWAVAPDNTSRFVVLYSDATPARRLTAAGVWAAALEGTVTAQDLMRLFASVLVGLKSNVDNLDGTETVTFRDLANTKVRVVGIQDKATGSRTSITRDAT